MFSNMLLALTTCTLLVALVQAGKFKFFVGEEQTDLECYNTVVKPPALVLIAFKEKSALSEFTKFKERILENMYLKPMGLDSKKYVFLFYQEAELLGSRRIPFTSFVKTEDTDKHTFKIALDGSVTFIYGNDYPKYIIDIGDGDVSVNGKYHSLDGTELTLKIIDPTFKQPSKSTADRLKKLKEGSEIHIGGPYIQIVDHEFLQWSAFTLKKVDHDQASLTIRGSTKDRVKYWIKENGAKNNLFLGELFERGNGAGEFRIELVRDIQFIVESITKLVCPEGSYLRKSVLSLSASASEDTSLPDRKIFHVTEVKANEKHVAVIFKFVENQNGHSFTHVVTVDGGRTFLPGVIYFNKGADTGGTVIVYPPKEQKSGKLYMEIVKEFFVRERIPLQVSGPWDKSEIKVDGKYDTPFTLTVPENPIFRDGCYVEFFFSKCE